MTTVPKPAPSAPPARPSVAPAAPLPALDLGAFLVTDADGSRIHLPASPDLGPNDVAGWRAYLQTVVDDASTPSANGMHATHVHNLNQSTARLYLASDPLDPLDRKRTERHESLHLQLMGVLRLSVELHPAKKSTRMTLCSPALQEALAGWLIARGAPVDERAIIAAAASPNPRLLLRVLRAARRPGPIVEAEPVNRLKATARRWLDRLTGAREAERASSEPEPPSSQNGGRIELQGPTSPLHQLANGHRWSSAKRSLDLLLGVGWPLEAPDELGQTPLLLAVKNRFAPLVDLLLARGANPNTVSTHEETPLGRAVVHNMGPIVQRLLAAGADPTTSFSLSVNRRSFSLSVSRHGHSKTTTPVEAAVEVGASAALEALMAHGVVVLPLTDPHDPGSPLDEYWLNVAREKAANAAARPSGQHPRCVELLERILERHVLTQVAAALPVDAPPRARSRSRL